jgi:methylated-DNA-[protein]-cysteine S-methyltransferase
MAFVTSVPRTVFPTPIGVCALAWGEHGFTAFWLPEAAPAPGDVAPPPPVQAVIGRVQRHLRGEWQDFSDLAYDFTLVPEFDGAVLRATLGVKAGQTRSYGEIAGAIGQTVGASRAVGRALGANRWPLLIPCHRIVSATGKMTGFSGPGGVRTKLRLLALEGAQLLAE